SAAQDCRAFFDSSRLSRAYVISPKKWRNETILGFEGEKFLQQMRADGLPSALRIALERGSFSLLDKISGFPSRSLLDPNEASLTQIDIVACKLFIGDRPVESQFGFVAPSKPPETVLTLNLLLASRPSFDGVTCGNFVEIVRKFPICFGAHCLP